MNRIIHIIHHTARAAATLLLAVLTAATAWADPSGSWEDYKAETVPQSEDGSTLYISTAEQLACYAYGVNHDWQTTGSASGYYCGRTVELLADIDLSAHYWKPIGINNYYYFNGFFHGNGHVITGMTVNGDPQSDNSSYNPSYGLFGYMKARSAGTGTQCITDLVLKDFVVNASCGTVSNNVYVGGLVGHCDASIISNCWLIDGSVSFNRYGVDHSFAYLGTLTADGNRDQFTNNYVYNVSAASGIGTGESVAHRATLTVSGHGSVALGGSVGVMSDGKIYAASGQAVTLSATADAGYLLGYTTSGVTLTDGTFTMPDNDDATIIATFTPITYTITYDLAGGSVTMENPATYTIESADITLVNPTRDGYTFVGWTGTDLNEATESVTIAAGSTGNRTFTAQWKKLMTNADIAVNIPSQEWTGSELTPIITVKDGETTLAENNDYTVTAPSGTIQDAGDYTFTITGAGNYSGETTATFTIAKATPTVTAPIPVENLVYNGSAQTLVTAGSTDFGTLLYSTDGTTYSAAIPTATDAGTYTVCYKVEASDNWNAVDAQTVSVTITPPPTYTVTFDANGGEGMMEPLQLTCGGEWTALPANTFTRTGYGFSEWNTKADGSGTAYRDEELVKDMTTEANGNVVLYAQWGWDIATCDIRGILEAYNDGYGPYYPLSNNVEVWNGETQLTLDTDYTIELDPNVGTYEYVVGQTYNATVKGTGDWGGTKTFTFTFVALHHTVVFVSNGGSGTMDGGTVANDGGFAGHYTLPACGFTAPDGKVFDHWVASCEPDAEKQPGDYFTAPYIWNVSYVQTITVTAYWRDAEKVNLTANLANGSYWTTYYNGTTGFKIDTEENACAYTATYDDGKLTLHNQGKEIPAGTAVIIVADNNEVSMTETTLSTFSGENDLHGVDVDTSTDDIHSTLGSGTFYVLGMTNGHFGFHKYDGTTMAARKAFVLVGGSNAALARSLTIVFDDATGIKALPADSVDAKDGGAWYTLDGRRLQGKPAVSGMYINNGKKIIVK